MEVSINVRLPQSQLEAPSPSRLNHRRTSVLLSLVLQCLVTCQTDAGKHVRQHLLFSGLWPIARIGGRKRWQPAEDAEEFRGRTLPVQISWFQQPSRNIHHRINNCEGQLAGLGVRELLCRPPLSRKQAAATMAGAMG